MRKPRDANEAAVYLEMVFIVLSTSCSEVTNDPTEASLSDCGV